MLNKNLTPRVTTTALACESLLTLGDTNHVDFDCKFSRISRG
jgi:hypothetical protein